MELFDLPNVFFAFIEFYVVAFCLFLGFADGFLVFLEFEFESFLFFFEFEYFHEGVIFVSGVHFLLIFEFLHPFFLDFEFFLQVAIVHL